MRKLFAMIMVCLVFMAGNPVQASTYTIYGGVLVSGTPIGNPVYVDLSRTGVWTVQSMCQDALDEYLMAIITASSANSDGTYPDPSDPSTHWSKVIAKKTNMAYCGRSFQ